MHIPRKVIISILTLCLLSCLFISSHLSHAAYEQKTIYIIPVKGTIDLGQSAFIKRAVKEAKEEKVAAVIFEINTFGGRVDAADEMVSTIHDLSPIPTYAYVTNTAWSAGALIAFSCKTIIMKTGSSIGSAEPRTMGFSPEQQTTDEKIISALRAKFKATAEANNHSINLAQAMVDKDVELIQITLKDQVMILTKEEVEEKKSQYSQKKFKQEKVIVSKGKLLNLTADEALKMKLSSLTVKTEDEFLDYIKSLIFPADAIKEVKIIKPMPTWSENLVRFLTHPIISSLLLSLGFLGLIFELKMPGWGISGTLGLLFIVLFFWGHYLVGLAHWADILIFVLGVILVFIELTVPGFGIFGMSGIILIITGLLLTLLKHPFTFPSFELQSALYTMGYTIIITSVSLILIFKYFPRTTLWKRVLLEAREKKELGYQTKYLPESICVGKIGKSKTILRPSGRAVFRGQAYDVMSSGEFITKGKKIKIIRIEGNKVFVEEIRRI